MSEEVESDDRVSCVRRKIDEVEQLVRAGADAEVLLHLRRTYLGDLAELEDITRAEDEPSPVQSYLESAEGRAIATNVVQGVFQLLKQRR